MEGRRKCGVEVEAGTVRIDVDDEGDDDDNDDVADKDVDADGAEESEFVDTGDNSGAITSSLLGRWNGATINVLRRLGCKLPPS